MVPSQRRSIHRPISLYVETVTPLVTVRELLEGIEVPLDLKGNRASGEALIAEIQRQLEINGDFWAISATTVSK